MLFIFEGIDGAGKTTQIQLLRDELTRRNQRVLIMSNPADSGITYTDTLSINALTLYHMAALRQINDTVIWPIVSRRIGTVLLDRGNWSTLAYQGYGENQLSRTERIVIHNTPDVIKSAPVIYFDLPLDVAQFRCRDDHHQALYGRPGYMERVLNGYRILASRHSWYHIDATKPVEQIHATILAIVDSLQNPI